MPVTVKKRGAKYRVVEADTEQLAKSASGTPLDGGGHGMRVQAEKQARAVNASLAKKGKI